METREKPTDSGALIFKLVHNPWGLLQRAFRMRDTPLLYIVNGPFAVGKSTTAKLLHQLVPMSLLLPVDELRWLFSEFRAHPQESLSMTEEIGRAMARVALAHGNHVVVDGLKVSAVELDPWVECAKDTKARVVEIFLWSSKETVLRRAEERGYRRDGQLNAELVARAWDRMNGFRAERHGMIEIDTEQLAPEQVLKAISDACTRGTL